MKILIVAENASASFGGEAAIPLHYFRVLRQRGHEVWLVVHERTRTELTGIFGADPRIIYMPDTLTVRGLWHFGKLLPARIATFSTGYLMRILTQRRQVTTARRLIAEEAIEVVHQPMPVSPREPSLLYGLKAPVVIGPLNGGMNFPLAFRARESRVERWAVAAGRAMTDVMNRIFPGKRRAAVVLVANGRTRKVLPSGIQGRVVEMPENGVDLTMWKPTPPPHGNTDEAGVARFVFVGRLVDWKAVDTLLHAFKRASLIRPMSLLIIGDGEERARLEALALQLGILSADEAPGMVSFIGWLSQAQCAVRVAQCDALVLPSLYECGGAVVLEAMALERPVIATNWGGPMDYLDPSCGILVDPTTPEKFVEGLENAMVRLAASPNLRRQMGTSAAEKIRTTFDWEMKVDMMLDVYRSARREDMRSLASTEPARSGGGY